MDSGQVLELALELLGQELTESRRRQLQAFCGGAMAECLARLRPDTDPGELGSCLQQAAAMLAVGRFLEMEEDGVTAFSAGRLSVQTVPGETGRRFREGAMELLWPWSQGEMAFLGGPG